MVPQAIPLDKGFPSLQSTDPDNRINDYNVIRALCVMNTFRVRIRKGDVEIEVESSDKSFAVSKLKELKSMLSLKAESNEGGAERLATAARSVRPHSGKSMSMPEHVRALDPKSGTQYVIAVGDFLEKFGDKSNGFKTRDIADGFHTVRYKHSNTAEAVSQAKRQGFLMDGRESGTLVLTRSAEAWVNGQLAPEAGE
jgi:hypothetical protein